MLGHVGSSSATVAHGEYYGCATANNVAAGIDFLTRTLHLVVHGYSILATEFHSFDRVRDERSLEPYLRGR